MFLKSPGVMCASHANCSIHPTQLHVPPDCLMLAEDRNQKRFFQPKPLSGFSLPTSECEGIPLSKAILKLPAIPYITHLLLSAFMTSSYDPWDPVLLGEISRPIGEPSCRGNYFSATAVHQISCFLLEEMLARLSGF